jgi:ectoine hydroxylase-related dioxygenase (phytanoyl-CoA dioxygenase family)
MDDGAVSGEEHPVITHEQAEAFERDGSVLVEGLFSAEEVAILVAHVERSRRVAELSHAMPDAEGRASKLALWMDLGQDVFGAVSASPRIVDSARVLLRDDVYHWHSKVMLKEPRVGGAWEWHQDYGYWYHDACLYPQLVSCMIALDPATRQNGCLKVLVGSHHLGRLDHGQRGEQSGIDPERVAAVEGILPVRYIEAGPGSALFFHCNLLHASEPNTSERPRRAYICCYNAFSNIPFGGKGHGKPVPIVPAPETAILQFGERA